MTPTPEYAVRLETLAPRSRSMSVPAVAAAVLVHAAVIAVTVRGTWWGSEPAGPRTVLLVAREIRQPPVASGLEELVAAAPASPDLMWLSISEQVPDDWFYCPMVASGPADTTRVPMVRASALRQQLTMVGDVIGETIVDAVAVLRGAVRYAGRFIRGLLKRAS